MVCCLLLLRLGGPLNRAEEEDDLINEVIYYIMTKVFVKQTLALPGSAKDILTVLIALLFKIFPNQEFVQQVAALVGFRCDSNHWICESVYQKY